MQHSIAISQVETQGTIHQNQDIQLVEVGLKYIFALPLQLQEK